MPIPAVVAAAIIGGGAGLGASAIASHTAGSIANQQQTQANALLSRSAPAYNAAQNYYTGLLNNPLQSPNIGDTQLQFNQARKNIIDSSMSRGGGLTRGLTNLEAGRAMTISDLIAGGRQNAAAGLTGLATGQSQQGLAGLAGAQQSQTQNSILTAQGLGGIGSFLTRLLAGGALSGFGGNSNASPGMTPDASIPNPLVGGVGSQNTSTWFNPNAASAFNGYFPQGNQ